MVNVIIKMILTIILYENSKMILRSQMSEVRN